MLAEILAANAAFAAIKTAIKNGKEIADVASQVGKYVNATEDLRRRGEKKRRGAGGADLEEFMHIEKLKQQEEELKQLMICLLYTSPSPRDRQKSRMPSSA